MIDPMRVIGGAARTTAQAAPGAQPLPKLADTDRAAALEQSIHLISEDFMCNRAMRAAHLDYARAVYAKGIDPKDPNIEFYYREQVSGDVANFIITNQRPQGNDSAVGKVIAKHIGTVSGAVRAAMPAHAASKLATDGGRSFAEALNVLMRNQLGSVYQELAEDNPNSPSAKTLEVRRKALDLLADKDEFTTEYLKNSGKLTGIEYGELLKELASPNVSYISLAHRYQVPPAYILQDIEILDRKFNGG